MLIQNESFKLMTVLFTTYIKDFYKDKRHNLKNVLFVLYITDKILLLSRKYLFPHYYFIINTFFNFHQLYSNPTYQTANLFRFAMISPQRSTAKFDIMSDIFQ